MPFGSAQGSGGGAAVAGLTDAAAVAITGGTLAGITSLTMADSGNVVLNTNVGTKIGTGATQKLGFFNQAPVAQPASSADVSAAFNFNSTFSDVELEGAVNAVAAKVNVILAKLRLLGLMAT